MLHNIFEKIKYIQDSLNNNINYLGHSYILEDKEERVFICNLIKEKIKVLETHLNELINYGKDSNSRNPRTR